MLSKSGGAKGGACEPIEQAREEGKVRRKATENQIKRKEWPPSSMHGTLTYQFFLEL